MSVKLEGYRIPNAIVITNDSFEHILNCLANQKFIHEMNSDGLDSNFKDIQDENQSIIDDCYYQARVLLHGSSK